MENLQTLARLLLDAAQAAGADSAQCTVMESETREFNVDGGDFSLMRTLFDRYITLSVLKGCRLGSVTVNRFDADALRGAALECVAAAEGAEPDTDREFAPGPDESDFILGAPEPDTEALFSRVSELMTDIAARHPRIIMEQLVAQHIRSRSVYMNSNGVVRRKLSGHYGVDMTYSAHEGNDSSSFYGGSVALESLDRPILACSLLDREMGEVETQLGAAPVSGKFTGTALFAPACLAGDVFGQILANIASDAPLIDGTSLWKDKLGERVADERISLSLAPHDPRIVCGQRWTGEGYAAEDFDLIRDGRLVSFRLSRYAANKTGLEQSKNTSSAMIVPPGDTPLADIIAGIDRGVFLMRFSGGHPSAGGEFSGVAKNGFLIENGCLGKPLTETMISGNLADMLLHLRAVSREVLEDGSVSMPYMAFDGVTISGRTPD